MHTSFIRYFYSAKNNDAYNITDGRKVTKIYLILQTIGIPKH